MTDDELRLNIESLHASIADLYEAVSKAQAKTDVQLAENARQIGELSAISAQQSEQIRLLAQIAASQQGRIERLEGR